MFNINQIIFLFRSLCWFWCGLFSGILILRLYSDLLGASWYGVTDSSDTFLFEDILKSCKLRLVVV